MIVCAIQLINRSRQFRTVNVIEVAISEHVVSAGEPLVDRLLRYETKIDRDLTRVVDRLERLQRRRKGEPIPPPLSVRLTQ